MKIIIAGNGKIGAQVANELSKEKHDIVIIDKKAHVLKSAAEVIDVLVVKGNGASGDVLREAGIEHADVLIATTSEDETNILSCTIGKRLGAKYTIARVRNPEYSKEMPMLKNVLGLGLAVNPELETAKRIARVLRWPSAITVDTFSKGRVEIYQLQIDEKSAIAGLRIADVNSRLRTKVLICAIERGEHIFIASGDFVLLAEDRISFASSPNRAMDFFKRLDGFTEKIRNVMIVGGGRISVYLAKLLQESGIAVKIIDRDHERCEFLSELLPYAMVVHGDANDQQMLLEEGIEKADAFVSLTGFDEVNIILSMYAKSKNDGKIVTKINKLSFSELVDNGTVGSIVSPKYITADIITSYIRALSNSVGSNVETLYKIIDNKVEALEFRVHKNSAVIGKKLKDIGLKSGVLVAAMIRQSEALIPDGNTVVQAGDSLIVVTTSTGYDDLDDILG